MSPSNSSTASRSSVGTKEIGRRIAALQFLDLEAEVDRDDDDDSGEEELDDFVVDDGQEDTNETLSSHRQLDSRLRNEETTAENLTPEQLSPPFPSSPQPNRLAADEEQPAIPRALWLVRCKPRKEFNVVVYAMHHAVATKSSVITSIHYRQVGDGVVYLDTYDPASAARILTKCAYVVHVRGSPWSNVNMRRVDEWHDNVRSLFYPSETIRVGTWVHLSNPKFGRKRLKPPADPPFEPTPFDYIPPNPDPKETTSSYYHDALALVVKVPPDSPGTYTILVVPHLDETLAESGAHSLHGPELGNQLLLIPGQNGVEPSMLEELKCKGLHLERGLRVENVKRCSIATFSEPPSSHDVGPFLASDHGAVVEYFPRVKDWVFEVGERVTDWKGRTYGQIDAIKDNGIEITVLRRLVDGTGSEIDETRFLGWAAFKTWPVGSYVQHMGGEEGIVVGGEVDTVFFWKGEGDGDQLLRGAHRNSLRAAARISSIDGVLARRRENVTMEALRLSGMSEATIVRAMGTLNSVNGFVDPQLMTPSQVDDALTVTKTFGNPWKFWSVLVWKGKHRGFYHVLDVIVSRETKSGLKLQVRTDIVNAAGNLVLVDYDYVVDADLLLPLHIVKPPPEGLSLPQTYQHPGITGLQKHRSRRHLVNADPAPAPAREVTPPPDKTPSIVSDEAAWDPNAEVEVSGSLSSIPAPNVEPWRTHHPSQHEYYELDATVADLVLFQVKLSGSIPDLKNHKYIYKENSSWLSIHFFKHPAQRTLAIDWQRLKGRIPPKMIIHPHRPNQKTNLPLMVMRGEHKDEVVTKVAGVGEELYVLPVVAFSGDVDSAASPVKVSCTDCSVIRLLDAAQKRWSQFKVKEWQRARGSAGT
ncbi:hypothetical protein PQX77_002533 [Marasmius sp. AFHP31]|nr:hypothetical protein PQX77_002533 [Marasmius sp. AFHP31]